MAGDAEVLGQDVAGKDVARAEVLQVVAPVDHRRLGLRRGRLADEEVQGGDPAGTGAGGPGYQVPAEIQLPHVEGAIAMARQADAVNPTRASSGSQFYITLAPTPFLDGAYTAFGRVIDGMDVVQSIAVGDIIEKVRIE